MIGILLSRPWGPSRPKGGGGQKVIKTVKTPPPPSNGKKTGWLPGCPLSVAVIAVPALSLLAVCAALVQHGT